MTKVVKTVETYNSDTVCKGKLVFVMCYPDNKDIWGKSKTLSIIGGEEKYNGRRVFPIIISETERPVPTENERVYSTVSKTISTFPDPRFFSDGTYFKLLAFPENFSQEQLQMIVDEKLKDGDEVLVECEVHEEWLKDNPAFAGPYERTELYYQIKLSEDNCITIFPIEKIKS